MSISKSDVEHVAKLARLGLSEDEKENLARELSAILSYAEKIQALPTQSVPPTIHALPLQNVFREDLAKPFGLTSDIILNGPDTQDSTFKVPKMLE